MAIVVMAVRQPIVEHICMLMGAAKHPAPHLTRIIPTCCELPLESASRAGKRQPGIRRLPDN
jgi:hypothetical protein